MGWGYTIFTPFFFLMRNMNNKNGKKMKIYILPKVEIINIAPESVICGSPDGDLQKYDNKIAPLDQLGNGGFFDEGEDASTSGSSIWDD